MHNTHWSPQGSKLDRRKFLHLTAGAAAGLALGTPAVAQTDTPRRGGVLNAVFSINPSSIDPIIGSSGSDIVIFRNFIEPLIDFDQDTLLPVPGLAKSWEFPQPDQMVLHLEEGVRFHDGTPFDAEAVKFNLDRVKNDPRSRTKADLASVEEVEVVGQHTVLLRLSSANAALPLILSDRAGHISSPTAVRERGDQYERSPVGTGRWKMARYAAGESIQLERNNDYRIEGQPYLDGINIRIITDFNTALRSVIGGENHLVMALNAQQEIIAQNTPDLIVGGNSTLVHYYVLLAYGRPPLDDVRVRQAINYAVDRHAFNAVMTMGKSAPAWSPYPENTWVHDPSLENYYARDLNRAKQLLAEAGHSEGFDLDIVGWNDQESQRRIELLIEQLRPIGVRLRPTLRSLAEATQVFTVEKSAQMYSARWAGRVDPSLALDILYGEKSFLNADKTPAPPGFDEAMARGLANADQEVRRQAIQEAQRIAVENALTVPLYYNRVVFAHRKAVKNYRDNAVSKPRFDTVYLDDSE